jgi:hypothetical protein
MVTPNLQVSVHSLPAIAAAPSTVALNPSLPIGLALASALPILAAAPANFAVAPAVLATPELRVLRAGRLVSVDPSKTAEQQHIRDGDQLVWETAELTNEELLTKLVIQTVKQGDLEKAMADLRLIVGERRDFAQRGHALVFILSAFAALLSVSLAMLIADGLGAWGFHLTEFVRNALVTSVLGEVVTLVAIAFRFLFRIPASQLAGAT